MNDIAKQPPLPVFRRRWVQRVVFWIAIVPPLVFLCIRFLGGWAPGIFAGCCVASLVMLFITARLFDPWTVPSLSFPRVSGYFLKVLALAYAAAGIYLVAISVNASDNPAIEKKYVALGGFSALVCFKLAALTFLTGDGALMIAKQPE